MKITNVKLPQPDSSLDIYQSNSDVDLPAVVIIPGGSYKQIKERDSERVALTFATHAFQSFVVRYPILEHRDYQQAQLAIAQAFDYIVDHAAALRVDTAKLGIIGFSAGGQLAAAYSNRPETKAKFAALGYPVIKPTIDDRMKVQTEDVSRLVTATTPATFLWGSINDGLTPFLDHVNAYAVALAKQRVPFELHEFGTGNHGIALANKYTGIVNRDRVDRHMSRWFPLFLEWLDELNLR
ncbi:alpha/beta hydrolase [Limosilactobacillus sp.]|jgi:acetyl esterase/lipase|uniref:alpha/beta hydrolase n=1 Tax=Limosilactobacillus sp. TaxID=2773925 RepID=UPI0025BE6470|nr:alpha/beta hydrolase [Limosilactobacillus sp.]MCH3921332.1 alpha/beta hydrolase [Limosilactobacillus sp.]MCH3928103.1 alpha/beta hydrolase [Limosilactobacillus sp.]